jgi:hypothetical protein
VPARAALPPRPPRRAAPCAHVTWLRLARCGAAAGGAAAAGAAAALRAVPFRPLPLLPLPPPPAAAAPRHAVRAARRRAPPRHTLCCTAALAFCRARGMCCGRSRSLLLPLPRVTHPPSPRRCACVRIVKALAGFSRPVV